MHMHMPHRCTGAHGTHIIARPKSIPKPDLNPITRTRTLHPAILDGYGYLPSTRWWQLTFTLTLTLTRTLVGGRGSLPADLWRR